MRQFPALVNCCTIDWFSQWPADALKSVALRFLNDIPDLDATESVMEGLVSHRVHHIMVALGQVAGSLPFSASKYVNGIFSFADSLNQEIYPTEGMKAVLLKIKQAVGLSIRWMKTSCL